MASSILDTARAQVAHAHQALEDVLITGADTGTARDALAPALNRLEKIEASAPRPDEHAEQDMVNEAGGLLERYRPALALALTKRLRDALLDLGDHLSRQARGTNERLRVDPRLGRVMIRGVF